MNIDTSHISACQTHSDDCMKLFSLHSTIVSAPHFWLSEGGIRRNLDLVHVTICLPSSSLEKKMDYMVFCWALHYDLIPQTVGICEWVFNCESQSALASTQITHVANGDSRSIITILQTHLSYMQGARRNPYFKKYLLQQSYVTSSARVC